MARKHARKGKKLKEADKGPGARGQETPREKAGGTRLEQKLLMPEKYRVCKTSFLRKQLGKVHGDF